MASIVSLTLAGAEAGRFGQLSCRDTLASSYTQLGRTGAATTAAACASSCGRACRAPARPRPLRRRPCVSPCYCCLPYWRALTGPAHCRPRRRRRSGPADTRSRREARPPSPVEARRNTAGPAQAAAAVRLGASSVPSRASSSELRRRRQVSSLQTAGRAGRSSSMMSSSRGSCRRRPLPHALPGGGPPGWKTEGGREGGVTRQTSYADRTSGRSVRAACCRGRGTDREGKEHGGRGERAYRLSQAAPAGGFGCGGVRRRRALPLG